MSSNNGNKARSVMGNRVLLTQYSDLLSIIAMEEKWTELRVEMMRALMPEDRIMMPGIQSAEILQVPNNQRMTDTPTVIVSIEGLDGLRYEWEAAIEMTDNKQGFQPMGQIHVMSVPETDFIWKPALSRSQAI